MGTRMIHINNRNIKMDEDFMLDAAEEAIDFIRNGNTHYLNVIEDLIIAVRLGDTKRIKTLLENINTCRFEIFGDGLYHLPVVPLQSLVSGIIDMAEDSLEDDEDEDESDSRPSC